MTDVGVIDTGFRSAIRKLDRAGRLLHVHGPLDRHLPPLPRVSYRTSVGPLSGAAHPVFTE